jgi:hypothetical protein
MNSSMPQSGAAPSSPNAMPGGLGAILQQPNQAPKGASAGDMAEMLAMAKELPDSELADVLNGRSIRIPQSLAMIVAMGRKSLRTAMQGAQAQQQAQQPSVKDRFLAEEAQMAAVPQAGLDQLPAPNMDTVDMAGGGIVAFQNTGLVEEDPLAYLSGLDSAGMAADQARVEALKAERKAREDKQQYEFLKNAAPEAAVKMAKADPSLMPPVAAPAPAVTSKEDTKSAPKDTPKAAPKAPGIAALTAPKESDASPAREDLLAKLAGVGEKTRAGIAGLKNETQAQFLLDAMSALTGNRNLAEAGAKFGQLAAGRVGAMGKEKRALEKEANEYDLNLARYREAIEAGDKDRAFKYKQAADENRYRMAMVNKPDSGIALLNALKDPEMMRRYQEMNAVKRGAVYDIGKATDDFNKIVGDKFSDQAKQLKSLGITTPYQYQQYVLNQGGTMGAGTDLAAAARAEIERRSRQ